MAGQSNQAAGAKKAQGGFGFRSRVVCGAVFGVLLVGGCGAWAATSRLSGAVIAPGVLRVDDHVKVVQHRDGGIVAAIAVREGDTVKEGDVLIRLDGVQAGAELAIIRSQLDELAGRRARLTSQQEGRDAIAFPKGFAEGSPEAALIAAGELQLFNGDLQNRMRMKAQLRLQAEQLDQEVAGLAAQLSALNEEIALVEKEHGKIEGLSNQGLVEGSRLYTISRDLARMMGQRGEIEASRARAAAKGSEIQLQIIGIEETATTEAQRELRSVDATTSELKERYTATEDRLIRTEIRAPISGVVNELKVHTVGGVVSPAETLVTLVPHNAHLKIEVRLRTVDVDQIGLGQKAKLRFSAFNQRTTPEVEGRVDHISAAAQVDPRSGDTFYIGDVEIVGDLTRIGRQSLLPGMPVEVFVETEEVTAISYLIKPFTDQMARAFREE